MFHKRLLSCFFLIGLTVWLAAEADLKRRFKAEAVLADEIVAKAVKDAWELGKASAARVSIFSTRPTTEELDYVVNDCGARARHCPAHWRRRGPRSRTRSRRRHVRVRMRASD